MVLLSLLLTRLAASPRMAPVADPAAPEVHADRTVTFRFRSPNAAKVVVSLTLLRGAVDVPLTKGADGLWTGSTAPLEPDEYSYAYVVDGEGVLDPNNPAIAPNLIWPSNLFLVPGNPPRPWEVTAIPHGSVEHRFYHSSIIGDNRDFYVYTPPGYRPTGRTTYPVLYLFHGYSDMANGWTEVGKANFILDRLIAEGKAKPMIVVMTYGYGVPGFARPGRTWDRDIVRTNYDRFRDALLREVIPDVDAHYRTRRTADGRAIAGLSMGGSESLYIGLNALDTFHYVGAFSSGGLTDGPAVALRNVIAQTANPRLKYLWIACGTDDGLITPNRAIVAYLRKKGIRLQSYEAPGAHNWQVWRRNLIDFTTKLFR